MPISGPASFVPTCNDFINHWKTANTALGASGPLVLLGGAYVAALEALRDTLEGQRAGVESALNGLEEARANLFGTKTTLLDWLNRFNTKLGTVTGAPKWAAMSPRAFGIGDGQGKVMKALDDLADVWARYNTAAAEDLVLLGGTTLGDLNEAMGTLRVFYAQHSARSNDVDQARSERNGTQEEIRAVLLGYRKAIPANFEEGSTIMNTLPRYTPLPGSTPDPVVLSGTYNAETGEAELSWTGSTAPGLVEYEVRGMEGEEYDADDESVLDNIAPGAPRVWKGAFGLGVPGAVAGFRVYVKTETGNERASNTVMLTRPLE